MGKKLANGHQSILIERKIAQLCREEGEFNGKFKVGEWIVTYTDK